jgi:ATP-dependent Clp protease adaptor protein ClpS
MMSWRLENPDQDQDVDLDEDIQEPPMYKVLLHNDHYTTMEFVVYILQTVFSKTEDEAVQIMLNVHRNGVGVCGVFTAEVAETKVARVRYLSKKEKYPLQCTMEEV